MIVDTEPGTFERIFAPVSVWTLVATLPVSMIWGDSVWMVVFVGAIVIASFAFPKRFLELLDKLELREQIQNPFEFMINRLKTDWTGLRYAKSTFIKLYNLKMIEKYQYVLAILTGAHFMIAGARGERSVMGYFLIFGAFAIFTMIIQSRLPKNTIG